MLSKEEIDLLKPDQLRVEAGEAKTEWLAIFNTEKKRHDIDSTLGDTASPAVHNARYYFAMLAFRLVEIDPIAAKDSHVREAAILYIRLRWPGKDMAENDRLRDVMHREGWVEHRTLKRKLD
ncbi:hypothetical protein [Azospirillum sp. TSH64]|uniref:hypothetical protein n=1 Tax=Azospirillum sp. TSH64 TaxID=652740 RepID=UPI0011B1FDC6|nr:hypothetical protein [Azospirillum sp. TSH64]